MLLLVRPKLADEEGWTSTEKSLSSRFGMYILALRPIQGAHEEKLSCQLSSSF